MKSMKINAVWHARHRMPPRASQQQRMAWHLEHAKKCACRPIPQKLRARIRRLGRGG